MEQCVKTASQWYALWKAVEEQIEEEYVKLIGVKKSENGDNVLELEDRIEKLENLADRYQRKYKKCYKIENGTGRTNRIKTFNNGL